MKQPKRKYYIMSGGVCVGESWAVSAAKAITNFWWRECKRGDRFRSTSYDPEDFDAIEANY